MKERRRHHQSPAALVLQAEAFPAFRTASIAERIYRRSALALFRHSEDPDPATVQALLTFKPHCCPSWWACHIHPDPTALPTWGGAVQNPNATTGV